MRVAALAGVIVPGPAGGDADLDLDLAALAAALRDSLGGRHEKFLENIRADCSALPAMTGRCHAVLEIAFPPPRCNKTGHNQQ